MIGIIITGHGQFATGIYEASRQIVGEVPDLYAIDFPEDKNTEQLEKEMSIILNRLLQENKKVLILSDLLGGSPFKTASKLSLQNTDDIKVIAGTNLPLLLDAVLSREEMDIQSLELNIVNNAQSSICSLIDKMTKTKQMEQENGGI